MAWVWSVNHIDVLAGARAEQVYPGAGFVDWVGIDGYNWAGTVPGKRWEQPHERFDTMLARVRSITIRPVAITQVGTTTGGGFNVADKSRWITDYFGWARARSIRMSVWSNVVHQRDWRVFGGEGDTSYLTERAFAAYRAAVRQPWVAASNPANRRVVSDAVFLGAAA